MYFSVYLFKLLYKCFHSPVVVVGKLWHLTLLLFCFVSYSRLVVAHIHLCILVVAWVAAATWVVVVVLVHITSVS